MIQIAILIILAASGAISIAVSNAAADPLVREVQNVVIDGAEETWVLAWEKTPSSLCGSDEISISATCPCMGFAYGQTGKMWLVQRRGGREIERMDLGVVFNNADGDIGNDGYTAGNSYVQRWPLKSGDLEREDRDDPTLQSDIMSRPAPTIMKFANFDHDRGGNEFLIQVATKPCGKLQFAAVGASANRPHLHFLSSSDAPNKPLVMPLPAWQALLPGSAPHTLVTWECGDHGSEIETDLTVSAAEGVIRVKSTEYSCPADGEARKLLKDRK